MAEPVMRRSAAAIDDTAHLHRLGYAQELFRSMGGFQNFAISFTIISILAGCLTSYAIGFNQGGPVVITWGWLTGWFNLIGQIAVTAAIGFGCALFMTSLLNLLWDYPNSYGWIYFTYAMIILGAG